jgi:hypothetical protein
LSGGTRWQEQHVAATPVPEHPARLTDVDLPLGTVLAFTWLAAVVATSLTLWVLVGVIGNA